MKNLCVLYLQFCLSDIEVFDLEEEHQHNATKLEDTYSNKQEQQKQSTPQQGVIIQNNATNPENHFLVVKIYRHFKISVQFSSPDVSKGIMGIMNAAIKQKKFPGSCKLKLMYNCGLCLSTSCIH